ncbi:fatty acid synthase alpha subunit Lsd1 [Tilletia horrida]|nr:fatty acid synthase alpha subunit Lsd1 [Tilletia horrida]
MNRADPAMVNYMQFYVDKTDSTLDPTYELAKTFGQQLIHNCKEAMVESARYQEGKIIYVEGKRNGVHKLEGYVKEMTVGTRIRPQINLEKAQENIAKLWVLIKNESSMSKLSKATLKSLYTEAVRSLGTPSPRSRNLAVRPAKTRRASPNTVRPVNVDSFGIQDDRQPFLNIQRKFAGKWQTRQKLPSVYSSLLEKMARNGVSLKGQTFC